MKSVTIHAVLSWNPCTGYDLERLGELWDGKEKLTALDIIRLDIPVNDRLWAVLRPEMIDGKLLHELSCRFAELVLPIFEKKHPNDLRPREAIEAKRAWMHGEINDEDLAAARTAAGDAARDADGTAAKAAAKAAAKGAAWGAAEAAAWAAAWDAERTAAWTAWEAAMEAAGDAAWAAQIGAVEKLLDAGSLPANT